MTEKYTPEKVAELVADLRARARVAVSHEATDALNAAAAALAAVSAERDEAEAKHHRAVRLNNDLVDSKMLLVAHFAKATATGERILADALKVSAERDHLHKAITEALAEEERCTDQETRMWRILRAALDKEGNDET